MPHPYLVMVIRAVVIKLKGLFIQTFRGSQREEQCSAMVFCRLYYGVIQM
jgi:hypothetical protein